MCSFRFTTDAVSVDVNRAQPGGGVVYELALGRAIATDMFAARWEATEALGGDAVRVGARVRVQAVLRDQPGRSVEKGRGSHEGRACGCDF